jgi:hypothetical protein
MRSVELQASHDVTIPAWIARRCRGGGGPRPVRGAHATLVALVVSVLALAWPLGALAVPRTGSVNVDAPGLSAGPLITDAGLVWESSDGITLTSPGRSTVLGPPDPPNWDNLVDLTWFGQDWWALARPSGVLAGRIGGPLHELPLLGSCNPGSASLTPGASSAQYAIAGDHLYAALPHGCLAHRTARFGEVLAINLRSRRWHVLAPMPGTLDFMAASGKYLALAYRRATPRPTAEAQLLVRVWNTATGALVNQIRPPRTTGVLGRGVSGIQVDDYGDVLVSAGCCGASPGQLAHVAQPAEIKGWWWARAGSTVGRETRLGSDAVLSDGQVAFLSANAGDPESTIVVTNLLTNATRTVVAFSGSASPTSLALSGPELAWAQQSTVVSVVTGPLAGGVGFEECKEVPLSPPELASLDLRATPSSPVVVNGVPIPPQYAHEPPCIEA